MGFVDGAIDVRVGVRDVYSLWLDYEGYPRFMKGMDEVAVVGFGRLLWTGDVCGSVLDWEADVVAHVQDTRVQWRASDGRETGEVSFAKLDAGETRVHYQLEYEPAMWGVDEAGLRRCLHARVRDDLRAFKTLAEALAAR